MVRLAFSTVACPDWTIARVARAAAYHGYHAVEFRSLGPGGAEFTCEPGMTDARKTRAILAEAGIGIAGLATGVRYDRPVWPPVLGHALGTREASVDETKVFIELGAKVGAPFIRVFAFDPPEQSARGLRAARRRIVERLRQAADGARNTGVRLALENGGAFPRGADIASLIDEVHSPDLFACYANAPAALAGESPADGARALGWRLALARVKDLRAVRGKPGVLRPCPLGAGMLPVAEFVRAVIDSSARFLVYEWDAAWLDDAVQGLADTDEALDGAARKLIELGAAGARARDGKASAVAV